VACGDGEHAGREAPSLHFVADGGAEVIADEHEHSQVRR